MEYLSAEQPIKSTPLSKKTEIMYFPKLKKIVSVKERISVAQKWTLQHCKLNRDNIKTL